MNSKNLCLDIECLGDKKLLVNVRPAYTYADGKRGDEVVGYNYDICLPAHNLDKISIKILGTQQIEAPTEGYTAVEFSGLVARPYVGRDGKLALTATATAIKAIGAKS